MVIRINKNTTSDGGNTAKSDGSNLAMGSPEYKELIMDAQGLNEFEQEDKVLSDAGFRSGDIENSDEKSFDAYMSKVSSEQIDREHAYNDDNRNQLTTAERNVSHQVRKMELVDKMYAQAEAAAAKTPGMEDDEYVRDHLRDSLDASVYNEGIVDDFYPGSRTLNKYC